MANDLLAVIETYIGKSLCTSAYVLPLDSECQDSVDRVWKACLGKTDALLSGF